MSIFDADSSQRQCIAAARDVVALSWMVHQEQGRVRTMQLISELIQIQNGPIRERESTALEVVYARLKAAGLAEYLLELHSHKASRREVARELGGHLLSIRSTGAMSNSDVERLEARRIELSEYAQAMNEIRQPLGHSLHHIIGRIVTLQKLLKHTSIRIGRKLNSDSLQKLCDLQISWLGMGSLYERRENFLWRDLRMLIII